MAYLQLFGGFFLLIGGADIMVRGSVALARRFGVSPMVIGMTVIAFGTSAPEVVVSLNAALSGAHGIAVGNVVGSNIANVLLILGCAGLIVPIYHKNGTMRRDAWVLAGCTALFTGLCVIGVLDRIAGAILLVAFILFTIQSFRRGDNEALEAEAGEAAAKPLPMWLSLLMTVGGIAGVIIGADLMVTGGTELARAFGVSEEVIGLTLIALGTSLPELGASVVAAFRGHADVALGNVVGSNIFNMLLIAGLVSVVEPLPVPQQILGFDLWVMVGVTVLLLPFLFFNRQIGKVPALTFLVLYIVYMAGQATGIPAELARMW